MMARTSGMLNVMAVDYEVEFADDLHRLDDRTIYDARLGPMTDWMLDTFAAADVRATFFILGHVADRYPQLVRRIAAAGHEIGCHSYLHESPLKLSAERHAADLRRGIDVIEQTTGHKVVSFRSPNFSVTLANLYALDNLVAAGIRYDSSIFPVWRIDGGIEGFPRDPVRIDVGGHELLEFPLTVAPLLGREVQLFGGGYFRLAPLALVLRKLRQVNARGRPAQFYIHPYDLDADATPYPLARPLLMRVRMGIRRGSAARRFRALCRRFRFGTLRGVLDPLAAEARRDAAPLATYGDGRYRVYPLLTAAPRG